MQWAMSWSGEGAIEDDRLNFRSNPVKITSFTAVQPIAP